MTAWTWGGIVWAAIVIPAAVLIGRCIGRMDPGEDAPQQPDGAVDLLDDMPADCLSQAEIDARFVRIVASYDAERNGLRVVRRSRGGQR